MPNLTTTHAPLSEVDYEAIESAVMETSRGRWFLAEFARRNRHADTNMLLTALERIEAVVGGERPGDAADRIRHDLIEMANAIARTKAEIAAIRPQADAQGKFAAAGEELDSVVQATEAATSDILACAERIQELAWTLREQGVATELCDLIDAKATEVYTACSFQDLTGQRTRKVIGVLRYLETRIDAMIGIWQARADAPQPQQAGDNVLPLHGPANPGEGLAQADVDRVMAPEQPADPAAAYEHMSFLDGTDFLLEYDEMAPVPPAELRLVSPAPRAVTPIPEPRAAAPDPLAPIVALSAEEKLALFT